MELLLQLIGGCIAVPILVGLTVLIVRLRKRSKVSAAVAWMLIILLWGLFLLPVSTQLYWIFVEEPARARDGLPID